MNKEEKQEYIKNSIIDAIYFYLPTKKIEAMTSDEISDKADISKRTLYKYFSSKKEMYLAAVEVAFMDMAEQINSRLQKDGEEEIIQQIMSIGRAYLEFCFSNPIKADLILNFNEMYYIDDYRQRVEEIQQYSNKFELTPFIKKLYEQRNIVPNVSIESIALYLWSQVQGIASLMQSKKEWIKEYYKIDEEKLIDEHMELSKKILGEIK